jgi:signal-transduction protein with cAMP-binding, CBS, and nucleotidyltransferase domain
MLTVASILKSKADPHNVIDGNARVLDGLVMMNSMNLDYLVVEEDEHFMGIFSEKDYSRNVILKSRNSSDAKVHEVMTTHLPCVNPENTAEQCMKLMDVHQTHYLPVLSAGKFLGIITLNDVLHLAVQVKDEVFDTKTGNTLAAV